jgi:cytochrome P450
MVLVAQPRFNPVHPRVHADPYPTYRQMREQSPVHWHDSLQVWFLSRYAEVEDVLRDSRFSSAHALQGRELQSSMLFSDPPEHDRLRSLVSKEFTSRVVTKLRPAIQTIVNNLLSACSRHGEMEFVSQFAYPLPLTTIAELLGVPAGDQVRLKDWAADLAYSVEPVVADDVRERVHLAKEAMYHYLAGLAFERRRDPGEDLISALVTVQERTDRLSENELMALGTLLLVAGHLTTANLLSAGLLALIQHPAELARLRAEPGLIGTAVDELLRYTSPTQFIGRRALADVEVGGERIEAGQLVVAMIGAANRDPGVFRDPDQLDLGRHPNPHLAFGRGPHFCLGAPLAKLEGQVALMDVIERFPRLRLTGEPRLRPTIVLRGLEWLPLAF